MILFLNSMMNRGKLRAIQLREEIGIDDPFEIPLEDIVTAYGGIIRYKDMGNTDGRIVYGKNISTIYINSAIEYEGRKRFAIAHELGHLLMHKGIGVHDDKLDSEWILSSSSNLQSGQQEWEANQFATEYLMPSTLFLDIARKSLLGSKLIHSLADKFLASLTSVAYKYFDCDIHPIAMFHIYDGKIKYWKKSTDFKVFIKNITKLPPPTDSVAMEYIEADYKPIYDFKELVQPIVKSTWFELREGENDSEFFEYCIVTRSYRNILSIVWQA